MEWDASSWPTRRPETRLTKGIPFHCRVSIFKALAKSCEFDRCCPSFRSVLCLALFLVSVNAKPWKLLVLRWCTNRDSDFDMMPATSHVQRPSCRPGTSSRNLGRYDNKHCLVPWNSTELGASRTLETSDTSVQTFTCRLDFLSFVLLGRVVGQLWKQRHQQPALVLASHPRRHIS